MSEAKEHWENIYKTKLPNEVSWTQSKPRTSLNFIESFKVDKSAKIIDIGGGDSNLIDHLLELGYTDVTVLDISEKAIIRTKKRLGEKAKNVKWIVSDITEFKPQDIYDVWHDRATFHFFTYKEQIEKYLKIMKKAVSKYAVIGTFSRNGPLHCSGLDITQYDETSLNSIFETSFRRLNCFTEDHTTPFGTQQNFLFCSFKKLIITR